jgi:CPA2 family monovalent cation:H+ antiporter-2
MLDTTPRVGDTEPPIQGHAPVAELTGLEIKAIEVPNGSPLIGRNLRQIRLRNRTGASVVGTERDGQQMMNPDPTTTLQVRDRLFLMGRPEQIDAARKLLAEG